MITFALVAYLVTAGQVDAYIVDGGLTASDCRAALRAGVREIPLFSGFSVVVDGEFALACEPEAAS